MNLIHPVLQKIRANVEQKKLLINAPETFTSLLNTMPYDNKFIATQKGMYDWVVVFGTTQLELEQHIKNIATAGKYDCIFWACYPKISGQIKTDMKRDTVWKALSIAHLRPVTQIAIDTTWSALRGRPIELYA